MMVFKYFFVILLYNVSFVLLTPLLNSEITNNSQNKSLLSDNQTIDKILLSNKTKVFEELGLPNFSINKTESTSRTFQVLSFNSYIVGVVFKYLQDIFGKLIVPDSKIFFLQTLVNPFYPFQYADHIVNEIRESQVEKPVEQSSLERIIDLIKPFYDAGLKELEGLYVVNVVDPIVDYAVDEINQNAFDALLNDTDIKYDFLDYNLTNLIPPSYSNSMGKNFQSYDQKQEHLSLNNKTSVLNEEKIINQVKTSTARYQSSISDNKSSSYVNQTLNKNNETLSLENNTSNFEKKTFQNEIIGFKNVTAKEKRQIDYNVIDQVELNKVLNQNKPIIEIEMLNSKTVDNAKNLLKEKEPDSNIIFSDEDQPIVLNKDEYSYDSSFFIDNDTLHDQLAFISIEDCKDLKNCELENSGNFTNDNKLATSLQNEYLNELTNVPQVAENISYQLIYKPYFYLKERINEIKEHFKKDFYLIIKMFKSFIRLTSLNCRYKLVCLSSTFLSIHTPDFLKTLIPSSFEEDYFQLIEMANQHEYLNAFLTGFIGFDCDDFYSDDSCSS